MFRPKPPSFVNRCCRVKLFTTELSNSTPSSDQVPDEIYALPGELKGVDTTAEAVSWLAVAIQGIGPMPVKSCISLLRVPRIVPAS